MPSIKKVAEVAGVSVGTVSHVITGSVRLSETLRTKVGAAIRELNYHPNHVARSLKTSKTRTLGIIVPDMTISFYPQIIRGAEAASRQHGYSLIAVNSDDDVELQKERLSLLRSQRVEGILIAVAAGPTPLGQISRLIDAGIAVVCLDRIPDRVPVDSVSVDDVQAAEMGTAHLLGAGYRRIAIVTGPLSLKNERRRVCGYRKALAAAGLTGDDELIWEADLRPERAAALCRDHLRANSRRPDALFCSNGPTALGALRALRDAGLQMPADIGFATFDELTVDELFSPAITTVVQPAYDIGCRAADMLLRRIEGLEKSETPITVRLPATLKIRESSRSFEKNDTISGFAMLPK